MFRKRGYKRPIFNKVDDFKAEWGGASLCDQPDAVRDPVVEVIRQLSAAKAHSAATPRWLTRGGYFAMGVGGIALLLAFLAYLASVPKAWILRLASAGSVLGMVASVLMLIQLFWSIGKQMTRSEIANECALDRAHAMAIAT